MKIKSEHKSVFTKKCNFVKNLKIVFRNMQTYADLLSSAENKFTKLVKKPEKYLDPGPDLFDDIKLLSKE